MAQQSTTPQDQIGNWTSSHLVKYIRDVMDQQPLSSYQQLITEDLIVDNELLVNDKITFKNTSWKSVGGVGNASFQNSWVNWGSPYYNAAYWKDPLGFIHLRGMIKTGTVGSAAFTLPPGFRPGAQIHVAVPSNNVFGQLVINTNGTVVPTSPANNTFVSLDNISFR